MNKEIFRWNYISILTFFLIVVLQRKKTWRQIFAANNFYLERNFCSNYLLPPIISRAECLPQLKNVITKFLFIWSTKPVNVSCWSRRTMLGKMVEKSSIVFKWYLYLLAFSTFDLWLQSPLVHANVVCKNTSLYLSQFQF